MDGHLRLECRSEGTNGSQGASPSLHAVRYSAYYFGSFRVTLDGNNISELGRRNRAALLLKWFLLNPARRVSAEDLCALFWPDRRKESAINNLHVSLNHLRRILEPGISRGSSSSFIRRGQRNYYWFDPVNLWWTDVLEVRSLCAAARDAELNGETVKAISLYSQAADYYRLTFLPEDVYEDAFSSYRQEHELAHVQCLNHLMQLHLRSSQLPKALSFAMDILCMDPYSCDAVKTIVEVYALQGNIAGAIRQLDNFFRTLKNDMGLAPDNELLELRDSLARN